jgi:type IX secretion system PorP/SprF family membrane protein
MKKLKATVKLNSFLKVTILMLISVVSINVNAQQIPQFSQYMKNPYLINPGAAGQQNYIDVTAGGRMQWLGFSDAPKTMYVYVTAPIGAKVSKYNPSVKINYGAVRNPRAIYNAQQKHALGGSLIIDQYGAFQYIKATATYAFHLPVTDKMYLSFGANVGFSNRSFLKSRAQTLNTMTGVGTDVTYDTYANQGDLNMLDIGVGLYLYSNNLYVGITGDQLTKDFVRFGNGSNIDPRMHFNLVAGYKFELSKTITLTPSVLAKYINPSPLSIEGSLMFEWQERVWYGASYRYQDAVIAFVGMNITNRLRFGYSFDFSTSRFNNHSFGGHELNIGLML